MSREIDALIAEHVMGYKKSTKDVYMSYGQDPKQNHLNRCEFTGNRECFLDNFGVPLFLEDDVVTQQKLPKYSTDIKAAWEVVNWLNNNAPEQKYGYYSDYFLVMEFRDKEWGCGFMYDIPYEGWSEHEIYVSAKTAPMAICLAALKAKGIEVDEN